MGAMKLIFVGGFLGAGKTTLLHQAARRLSMTGREVAALTNDHASNLVDTAVLGEAASQVAELAGGCFCCRFGDLVSRLRLLRRRGNVEFVLGEPLGNCTDLIATVLRPLHKFHGQEVLLAPLSVVVDPAHCGSGAKMGLPADLEYVWESQIREADAVVISKSERMTEAQVTALKADLAEQFGAKQMFVVSATTGEGLMPWLEYVTSNSFEAGAALEIDYERYARAESSVGWLNATVRLQWSGGEADWAQWCDDLLSHVRGRLEAQDARLLHGKVIAAALAGQVLANVGGDGLEVEIRGQLPSTLDRVGVIVNLRACAAPEVLREIFMKAMRQAGGECVVETVVETIAMSPGKPRPTYRIRT